jgi:hypothetical protein
MISGDQGVLEKSYKPQQSNESQSRQVIKLIVALFIKKK